MQEIIKDLKGKTKKFRKAIKYLDRCGDFEFEDYKEAWRIAGGTHPESELRRMWDDSKPVLPGPGHSGGVESLREITRESFVTAIDEANGLIAKLKVIG